MFSPEVMHNFFIALKVMGLGMGSIFLVMLVLIGIVMILTSIKGKNKN